MNKIEVDADRCLAKVSGGALLGDLDRSGEPFGLVVPAGVVSHTGAAGLTLGGGMGWLSRRYGLTIDSVVSMNLITAGGESVTVSADNEPDLFWGLRGGGGNFGVVTEFTYNMHPLGLVWSGLWKYPLAKAPQALQSLGHLASKAPRELTTSFNLTVAGLSVSAFWSGAERSADALLSPFGKLADGGQGESGETRFVSHQSRHDELLRWGRRYYSKGGFFHELTDKIIHAMMGIASAFPTEDSDIYVLQLGGAVGDVDDSATAYTGRAAGYYWITSACWDDVNDDMRCIAWGRSAAAELARLSMSGNYVNEQGDMERDIAVKAYGVEKYKRLQRLKARLDPGNLFRLNQNIEPAASG
jgi:FAD/FMN-containing dehydrogenase